MTPEDETIRKGSSDNPVETSDDDALIFYDYVQGLKGVIEETETPFVLGIYGDWGVGKTSLMHLLEEAMYNAGHPTVWCNPWKYDQKEEVWKAVIREICRAIRRRLHFLDIVLGVGSTIAKLAKQVLDMLGRLVGVGDTGKELQAMFSPDTTFSNVFERKFDRQLRYLQKKFKGKRLVVFLDDLDRCSREAVIEVLEALKLYLDRKGCVFVLGVNHELVQDAAESKWRRPDEQGKQTTPVRDLGSRYLEKIVQLPFHIPPHDEKRLKEFLERLEVRERRPEGIDEAGADEWERYVRRVGEATGNNPRQIKRFINTVRLIARIAPQEVTLAGATEPITLERLKLAKVVLIQFAFNDFYRVIWRYHGLLYQGQQYAFDLKERREKGEAGVPEESPKARERLDRREAGFTLIDRDPELQRLLTEEPLWDSEEEAACYITYSGGGTPTVAPPGFADIQQDLLTTDAPVAQAAAEKVKEQGPEAVEAHAAPLRERLKEEKAYARWQAARALKFLADERTLPLLIARLKDLTEDSVVRFYAAEALGEIGDESAVEPLIAALLDEDEHVRWRAAGSLGLLGDERAVEPLIAALQDEDAFVRKVAAGSLGDIGDERALGPLIDVLDNPDEARLVRDGAAGALEGISTREALEATEKYRRS